MNERDAYLNDEIDLKEIFDVLWAAKKLIIQITAIFAVASVTYSLLLTNYYKSESLLIARNASESQGLSQYSGLAAMAGINLPSSGEDRTAQTIELIKSRSFVSLCKKLKVGAIPSLSWEGLLQRPRKNLVVRGLPKS